MKRYNRRGISKLSSIIADLEEWQNRYPQMADTVRHAKRSLLDAVSALENAADKEVSE